MSTSLHQQQRPIPVESLVSERHSIVKLTDLAVPHTLIEWIQRATRIGGQTPLYLLVEGDPGTGKTTLLRAAMNACFAPLPLSAYQKNILIITPLRERNATYYQNNLLRRFCQNISTLPGGYRRCVVIDDMDTLNETCQKIVMDCFRRAKNKIHFLFSYTNRHRIIPPILDNFLSVRLTPPDKKQSEYVLKNMIEKEKILFSTPLTNRLLTTYNGKIREMIGNVEKIYLSLPLLTTIPDTTSSSNLSRSLSQSISNYMKYHNFPVLSTEDVQLYIDDTGHEGLQKIIYIMMKGFDEMDNNNGLSEKEEYDVGSSSDSHYKSLFSKLIVVFDDLYHKGFPTLDILMLFIETLKAHHSHLLLTRRDYFIQIMELLSRVVLRIQDMDDDYIELVFFVNHLCKILTGQKHV